jgi:dTMP kinase
MMKPRPIQTGKGKRPATKRKGLFITFEGIEGCGKTTQCQRLAFILRREGYQVMVTREPGGTLFAEKIRALLLGDSTQKLPHEPLTPACEAGLVFASRAHHVTHKIVPALSQGMVVLCDRFSDSTLAYQGYGRGLDLEKLIVFNDLVTNWLAPDHTFLFDLPAKQGLARRKKARGQNRIDKESLSFHNKVRRGFLALSQVNSQRITVLDGRRSPEVIATEISATTHSLIALKLKSQRKSILIPHRTRVTA